MRTGRRYAFIFEEDFRQRAEHLLQAQGAAEWGRAPLGVDLADFLGNRIQRSADISVRGSGRKMAPIASGGTGLPSGPSGGAGGLGMSATTLYQ